MATSTRTPAEMPIAMGTIGFFLSGVGVLHRSTVPQIIGLLLILKINDEKISSYEIYFLLGRKILQRE